MVILYSVFFDSNYGWKGRGENSTCSSMATTAKRRGEEVTISSATATTALLSSLTLVSWSYNEWVMSSAGCAAQGNQKIVPNTIEDLTAEQAKTKAGLAMGDNNVSSSSIYLVFYTAT
jgi:hypothetical protein